MTVAVALYDHVMQRQRDDLVTLLPHSWPPDDSDIYGDVCGVAADPDAAPCAAWSIAGGRRCPKRSAVVLVIGYEIPLGGESTEPRWLPLCGGHLDAHRRRDLRVFDGGEVVA